MHMLNVDSGPPYDLGNTIGNIKNIIAKYDGFVYKHVLCWATKIAD